MNLSKRIGIRLPAAFGSFVKSKPALDNDRRSEQGAWIFLVSLTVFFVSCMILYALYVLMRIAPQAGAIQPFYLPQAFLLTTVNLVAISLLLHLAVAAARLERQVDLARYIVLAFVLAIAFFVIQGMGLTQMMSHMLQPGMNVRNLYGLTFCLVVVHALHVVGGVAGLTLLLFGLWRGAYDHERYFPVKFCAMYWHFLDLVWVIMLASFALAAVASK